MDLFVTCEDASYHPHGSTLSLTKVMNLGVFLKTVNLQLILLHKATCDEQLANILALIALRFLPFTDLQNSFNIAIILTHTCLSLTH